MSRLRVLIADDEQVARQRLRRLLSELDDVEVIGECADGYEVLARLREGAADVLLLDIKMPRMTGMEAAALVDPAGPVIVFTTAYAEHAVEAFEHEAVDYLLKPVDGARLATALERAQRQLKARERIAQEPHDFPDRVAVPTRKGLMLVEPGNITHAMLDGETCQLFTINARFVTDFRLSELEKRLPPGRFERLHRRCLVNMDYVERLEPVESGGYLAHIRGGHRVEVSRGAARRLRKRWALPR